MTKEIIYLNGLNVNLFPYNFSNYFADISRNTAFIMFKMTSLITSEASL